MHRRAAVAGSWYPAGHDGLAAAVDRYLIDAGAQVAGPPRAIVVPHAGLQYSGPVAAYAYAAIREGEYRAVVLVGPSHYEAFEGVSIWPRGSWETPCGPMVVDEPLAHDLLEASPMIRDRPSAHAREHALEMQLPFLVRLLPDVPIVPLVMGRQTRVTAETLGRVLAAVLSRAPDAASASSPVGICRDGILLVASSDLSHYEDARTAAVLDAVVLECLEAMDPARLMAALEREPRHACGGGPMVSVLHAARALGASHVRVLRYADSGDVSGDKSSVVGYVAAALW